MTDNDKKQFAAAMAGLYKIFNKEPDTDITRVLFFTLQHLDIAGAEYCISQAILKEARFPLPKDLVKYQHEIPRKALPRVEYKAEYNDKLKDQSMRIINGILDGEFTKEQTIKEMEAMEIQHPRIGWSEQAASLARYYSSESRDTPGGWHDRD